MFKDQISGQKWTLSLVSGLTLRSRLILHRTAWHTCRRWLCGWRRRKLIHAPPPFRKRCIPARIHFTMFHYCRIMCNNFRKSINLNKVESTRPINGCSYQCELTYFISKNFNFKQWELISTIACLFLHNLGLEWRSTITYGFTADCYKVVSFPVSIQFSSHWRHFHVQSPRATRHTKCYGVVIVHVHLKRQKGDCKTLEGKHNRGNSQIPLSNSTNLAALARSLRIAAVVCGDSRAQMRRLKMVKRSSAGDNRKRWEETAACREYKRKNDTGDILCRSATWSKTENGFIGRFLGAFSNRLSTERSMRSCPICT